LFDLLGKFWTNITHLWENIEKLVQSILSEINAWRNFKEEIAFKYRVVSLPAAIDKSRQLLDQIISAKDAVIDLWNQLKGKFEATGNPTEEAEQAIQDIEASGFKAILEKFPKLVKGAEKVLGFVAIVADALESIIAAVQDLQAIVDVCRSLREEIETANTIFLSQSNRRKIIRLEDGTTMKIRLGNLHS
jgi:hypothetical protein